MHKIQVLDQNKPILLLKWSGVVEKKEALDVIPELLEAGKKLGGSFYFLVDVSEMKLNNANEEFVQHQKATLHMCKTIAVVVNSAITKLQIRKMAEGSNNNKEYFFNNYEEALAFLKKQ